MKQAAEILKSVERRVHRHRNRYRIIDARQHEKGPILVKKIMLRCPEEDKTSPGRKFEFAVQSL
jgi:hypothetical protein